MDSPFSDSVVRVGLYRNVKKAFDGMDKQYRVQVFLGGDCFKTSTCMFSSVDQLFFECHRGCTTSSLSFFGVREARVYSGV